MHGLVIEERRCPTCRNPRTARVGGTSFCFNCRTRRDEPILGDVFGEMLIAHVQARSSARSSDSLYGPALRMT
jgi:hypothetical protein